MKMRVWDVWQSGYLMLCYAMLCYAGGKLYATGMQALLKRRIWCCAEDSEMPEKQALLKRHGWNS